MNEDVLNRKGRDLRDKDTAESVCDSSIDSNKGKRSLESFIAVKLNPEALKICLLAYPRYEKISDRQN